MRGLNRIEMLVILLAGLVMVAIAVPWLMTSRDAARDNQCANNLQELHKAFSSYSTTHGEHFPFGTIVVEELPPEKRLSWNVAILPSIPLKKGDPPNRLDTFDRKQPWDADVNKRPLWKSKDREQKLHRFGMFRCPADENNSPSDEIQFSSYVGMTGLGKDSPLLTAVTPQAGVWGYDRKTRYAQIVDGREHTVNLLETGRDNGPWTAGGSPTLRPLLTEEAPPIGFEKQFGGHHAEGAQVLFADGSVRQMSNATDATVFERLCTIAGK